MALFKRVLEIQGKFIPQQYKFLLGWVSRDRNFHYEWTELGSQLDYCSYKTLEEAKNSLIIKSHKI